MCIAGMVQTHPDGEVDSATVHRMCEAIVHRGPDDEGIFVKAGVGLGMRRLSIIDLTGGHQPVFNEDKTLWIVFNGEIYNFPELRSQLQASGHLFSTHSDTEVIVHLYEEYGAECVHRLRGMFAFGFDGELAAFSWCAIAWEEAAALRATQWNFAVRIGDESYSGSEARPGQA